MPPRCLLDTPTLLWMAGDVDRLSDTARQTLADPTTHLVISVASVWEIAAQLGAGQLRLDLPLTELIRSATAQTGIALLPVELPHTLVVPTLPLHHHDLFDRLLVAQCMVEDLVIVSDDAAFDAYPVKRLW